MMMSVIDCDGSPAPLQNTPSPCTLHPAPINICWCVGGRWCPVSVKVELRPSNVIVVAEQNLCEYPIVWSSCRQ